MSSIETSTNVAEHPHQSHSQTQSQTQKNVVYRLGGPGVIQTYFIGDPYYALSDEYYSLLKTVYPVTNVEVAGRILTYDKVSVYPPYMEGTYYDQMIYRYKTISGNLGIIPWELCTKLHKREYHDLPGRIITMENTVTFTSENGVFTIQTDTVDIKINTCHRDDYLSDLTRLKMKNLIDDLQYHIHALHHKMYKYHVSYDPLYYTYFYDEDTEDEEEIQIDHMGDDELAERLRAKIVYVRYLENLLDTKGIWYQRFNMFWEE